LADDHQRLTLAAVSDSIPSVELAEAEYQSCRAGHGPEDPVTLNAQMRLARAYYEVGQYGRAEDLYSSVFAMRGRLVGLDDPSTLSSAFGLAGAFMKSKAWTSARPVLEDLLERSDRVHGSDSDMSRRIAINLANTYRELGRFGDELPLRQRILAQTRQTPDSDPEGEARSLVDLAKAFLHLGNHELALSVSRDALAAQEESGASFREIVLTKWRIAGELVSLKRPDEASAMFEQVLRGVEQLEQDDPLRRRARKQRRSYSLLARLSGRGKITAP
jgi:tetratricopeptide (TPR) repeat protein